MTETILTTTVKDLTEADYKLIGELVYKKSGINLGPDKMQLVRTRLGKMLRTRNFSSYNEYYKCVVADKTGEELTQLLDAISTNTTHLFREDQHFDFLADELHARINDDNRLAGDRTIRIWSAACSTGEEPHSIAMVAHDTLANRTDVKIKILATDISTRVLAKAQIGLYPQPALEKVPGHMKAKYLRTTRTTNSSGQQMYQLDSEIAGMVKYARFNLMTPQFPFRNKFDIIFCRNVMIYFDHATQERLVAKFEKSMACDGFLLVGHSEGLHAVSHSLKPYRPAVYKKA